MKTVWSWAARLSKSGSPFRELVQLPEAEVPPGAGFSSRHEAKQYGKRKATARPIYLREDRHG